MFLDLSDCTVASASFGRYSPPPQYSWPEKRRHNTVIVPDGTRGVFFPPYVDVRYASGTKIVPAADVMRSTLLLFPDREMYRKYIDNHKKYALILCDELPEDYSDFLYAYFGE